MRECKGAWEVWDAWDAVLHVGVWGAYVGFRGTTPPQVTTAPHTPNVCMYVQAPHK